MKQQVSLSALLRSTFVLSVAFLSTASPGPHEQHAHRVRQVFTSGSAAQVCNQIKNAISNASDVYWPCMLHLLFCSFFARTNPAHFTVSTQYADGVDHYMSSSEQKSACVVEPGIAADVGKIVSCCIGFREVKPIVTFLCSLNWWEPRGRLSP